MFWGGGFDCADELWMGAMPDPVGIGPAAAPDPEGKGPAAPPVPEGIGPAAPPDAKGDGKEEPWIPPEGEFTPTEIVGRADGTPPAPVGREPPATAELEAMTEGVRPLSAPDGLIVGKAATLLAGAVSVIPVISPLAAAE